MLALLVVIAIVINAFFLINVANSEEREYTECWVLCQPDSFVNARLNPQKKSIEIARLDCGDNMYTDGKSKGGYLHCYGLGEWGEGWVHKGYIVYSKPYIPDQQNQTIKSNGRVAARRTIGGDRRCWLKHGQEIKVYMVSDEWSVTNKGFVQTKFILGE